MKTLTENNIKALKNMKYAIEKGVFLHPAMPGANIEFFECENHIYYIVTEKEKKHFGIIYSENIYNNYEFFGYFTNEKVIKRVKNKLKNGILRPDVLKVYNNLDPAIICH